MRLGLSMRVNETLEQNELRDSISHDWYRLLQAWNHVPVLIPNGLKNVELYLSALSLNGLILTGGNDLSPHLSGIPENKTSTLAPLRDQTEHYLLNYAVENKIPVLGVCRGLQTINCYFGGTLSPVKSETHVAKVHAISVHGDSWGAIFGYSMKVNSYHRYGIASDSLAKTLIPFAFDQEGFVEAAAHNDLPVLGIMWHPERIQPEPLANEALLSRLLTEGVFWKL